MGVKLRKLVEPEQLSIEKLSCKTLAVDAMNTIFQFLSIIRQRDGTPLLNAKGDVTSHISGLFYRNINLLKADIRPVYVFDGVAPLAKSKTQRERRAKKVKARKKLEEAREAGDEKAIRKYAMRTAQLKPYMVEEAKRLLTAMGVPCIQAPGEGEAQAAVMCEKGQVYAVASQDYDALMFGSPRLLRNLNITGKRKVPRQNRFMTIYPELIELKEMLSRLKLTQLQLIQMGILVGTDYNPGGVKGIGPKKALKAVRENRFDELYPDADWLIELFTQPDVDEVEIDWPEFDGDKVIEVMCERNGFGLDRVQKLLTELAEARKAGKQQALGAFM